MIILIMVMINVDDGNNTASDDVIRISMITIEECFV